MRGRLDSLFRIQKRPHDELDYHIVYGEPVQVILSSLLWQPSLQHC